jgi:hypothetical protein
METFSEREIQETANFVNLVYQKATFTLSPADANKLTKGFAHMHQMLSRMESLKVEFKGEITPEKTKPTETGKVTVRATKKKKGA